MKNAQTQLYLSIFYVHRPPQYKRLNRENPIHVALLSHTFYEW